MARKAEGTGKIRADLEGATLALVDVEEVVPYVVQQIEQAIRRAGLDDLLAPALDDVQRICQAVKEAKSQIGDATVKLMEK